MLTAAQVAEKYGIPLRTVQAACKRIELRHERVSRLYLIAPEAAEEFAAKWINRQRPRSQSASLDTGADGEESTG